MGIMAFGAFRIGSIERSFWQPLSTPHTMCAALPVVINQTVTPGTELFHVNMHNSRPVIGSIFIAVQNMMAIKAPVIAAMT